MRYCSIDIETSGLNPETCQVLEIGIIVEDTFCPRSFDDSKKLNIIIDHDTIHGEPYAINMNARIFKILAEMRDIKDKYEREAYRKEHSILNESEVSNAIWKFLYLNGFGEKYKIYRDGVATEISYAELCNIPDYETRIIPPPRSHVSITAAGKNFSRFDMLFLNRLPDFSKYITFRQRVLDPALAYTDFECDDVMPNLAQCFEKMMPGKDVVTSHEAIMDAWDVICLLRPLYDTFRDRMALHRSSRYLTPRQP